MYTCFLRDSVRIRLVSGRRSVENLSHYNFRRLGPDEMSLSKNQINKAYDSFMWCILLYIHLYLNIFEYAFIYV